MFHATFSPLLTAAGLSLAALPLCAVPSAQANLDALRVGDFALSPSVVGVHPRLYSDPAGIESARKRYRETPEFFARFLPSPQSLELSAPIPSMNDGITPQRTMFDLCRLAAAWRVTGDEAVRRRLLQDWTPILKAFRPIVTKNLGGGEGLTSGHILFGLSFAYDTLYGAFDPAFENLLRNVIIAQGSQTYADLVWRKSFAYEQNHLIIPVCGLAIAALAVVDEHPEARDWGVFSTNLLKRTFAAIAQDGWFFEGISYWSYTMQFPAAYALALKGATGRDIFSEPPFRDADLFLAHMFLPHPRFVFDFGDWGPRTNSDGITAQKGYELPWHTLTSGVKHFPAKAILRSKQDPFLAAFIARQEQVRGNNIPIDQAFDILWQDAPLPAAAEQGYSTRPPYHYFPDMDVVHWRSGWFDPDATAIAFKSGPPAGHRVGALLPDHPEWKPSLGHAHPDAGSFILFAKGVFLANDTGYVGKKETANCNSILIDGVGQAHGGTAWGTFPLEHYPNYDKIHMRDVWLTSHVAAGTAVFADAYDAKDFAMERVNRHLMLIEGRFLVIVDDLRSEKPHTYEFRLHGDREPTALDERRVLFQNGPAQLVVTTLSDVARRSIAPTVVETELVSKTRSRPQRRGFHVALDSPKVANYRFVTAACIQAGDESPDAFTAVQEAPGRLRLSDGKQTCVVWLCEAAGLEGSFAYALLDPAGVPVAAGLKGVALSDGLLSIRLTAPGSAEFVRDQSGAWRARSVDQTKGAVNAKETGPHP